MPLVSRLVLSMFALAALPVCGSHLPLLGGDEGVRWVRYRGGAGHRGGWGRGALEGGALEGGYRR